MTTRVMPASLTQVIVASIAISLAAMIVPLIVSSIALSNQNNGFSTPFIQLTNTSARIFHVGPLRQYKSVSDVFSILYGLNIPNVTIIVDAGTYNETVTMSGNSVRILGDNRTIVGTTFVNGHPLAVSPQITYLIQGIYPGLGASFGAATNTGGPGIVVPAETACSNTVSGIAGKIAIVARGICSFYIKANTLFNSGAIGVIIHTDSPLEQPVGGNYATLPIPVVLMSSADVATLNGTTVTIATDFLPIGDPGTTVTFTQLSAESLQINAAGLNLSALKLVPGDEVVLTADSGDGLSPTFMYRTIEAILSDNVLVLDAALDVSVNATDSTITFLPNVHILRGSDIKTTFAVMSGIHFASDNVVIESSDVYCSRCALYGLSGEDNTGFGGSGTILGGQVVFTDSSSIAVDNLVVIGSIEGQQIVLTQSTLYVNNYLQTLWGTSAGIFPGGALYMVQSTANVGYFDAARCISGNGNGAAATTSAQSTFTVSYVTTINRCNLAIMAFVSSTVDLQGDALIGDCNIGIYAYGGSIIRSQANVILTNMDYTNYIFDDTAVFDVYYSSFAPFNQLGITGDGTVDPYFTTQIINSGSPLALQFNPAVGGGLSYSAIGKRYTFINSAAVSHTISLTQGFYYGYGIPPNSETVLTTSNEIGSVVVLYVVDPNTVVVESALGCVFAKKRRDNNNFITVSPFTNSHNNVAFLAALRNSTARTSPKVGGILI